jgi:hypothetical protein
LFTSAQSARRSPDNMRLMKTKFTDGHRYPRGYVRSESTDIARTWAIERKRLEEARRLRDGVVRPLKRVA